MLNLKDFPVTVELSSVSGTDISEIIEQSRSVKADALNVPDGILGRLTIDPIVLAAKIKEATGKPVIAHLTCRDCTRLALASRVVGASSLGVDGILALTGDAGKKNVFEIRSPGLVELVQDLNSGSFDNKKIKGATELQIGVAANPNVGEQIDYLKQKVESGAQFVQTQPVFSLEVAEKFLDDVKKAGIDIPILLGIMPLKSVKVAEYFNQKVTGITVPENVIERLRDDEESGAEIAIELLYKLKGSLDGVHVMPLGVMDSANKIYEFLKEA